MASPDLISVTELFADLSATLIKSGANTNRALRNVKRIATHFNYDCQIFHSYSGVVLTVQDLKTKEKFSEFISIPAHGINFNAVSDISILSWNVIEEGLNLEQIKYKLEEIKSKPHYPKYITWAFVGLAGAALCRIFDGDYLQFIAVFVATFAGLYARSLVLERKFNVYICWFVGAFASVSTVGIFNMFNVPMSAAFTTCVLWMIPGVPLINGLIDVLSGHLISGFAKYVHAMILIFMIAVGYFLSLTLFHNGGF
ncbi:threonine/serine exporter [Ornithobacterium rhinotracheale]|uniref:Threonine/serine exporter n=1 Tax=Ornithobacterium rhinotracheale TaxID=28251 RepID=A0A3R5WZP8_ORNRH|nr:threonine/serine exporter family protein [Ornithobacterium rhinotracheale]QAR30880.1 threonine/serine exporter [Ornithobacterium rhinotracheale]